MESESPAETRFLNHLLEKDAEDAEAEEPQLKLYREKPEPKLYSFSSNVRERARDKGALARAALNSKYQDKITKYLARPAQTNALVLGDDGDHDLVKTAHRRNLTVEEQLRLRGLK